MVTAQQTEPLLLNYLPAIYRRSAGISTFLAAFDAVFFGPDEDAEEFGARNRSLNGLVDGIAALFDPTETPSEFLPWLGQWAALRPLEGMPESRVRRLISEMIPLYGIRGTKAYVERTLALYMDVKATVTEEELAGLRVGTRATVGRDTRLGEDPFQFRVELDLTSVRDARGRLPELLEFASLVVHLAKPAHTRFRLTHNLPEQDRGLVVALRSTVGVDTLLWKPQMNEEAGEVAQ